jgi:hypothetical protein
MGQLRGAHFVVLGMLLLVSVGLGLLLGLYVVPTFTHWQKVPCTVTSSTYQTCTENVCTRHGKINTCRQRAYACCSVGVLLQLHPPEPWTVSHRGSCPSVGQIKTCAFAGNDKRNTLTIDFTSAPVGAIVAIVLYGVFWIICCIVSLSYLVYGRARNSDGLTGVQCA